MAKENNIYSKLTTPEKREETDEKISKVLESVTKTKIFKYEKSNTYETISERLDGLQKAIVVVKNRAREKIKTATRTAIYKTKIFSNKKSEAVIFAIENKVSNVVEKITSYVVKIKKYISKILTAIWSSLKYIGKTFLNVISPIFKFLSGIFKTGWKFIDGFMSAISPKVWNVIKKVTSVVFSAVKWVWNFGKKMLSYIWEGVKTIFKFGYEVMATVAKTLYRGTKFLFTFWFRMLINTLFSPSIFMWIINIPIFLAVTSAIFIALGTIGSFILDLAIPVFKSLIDYGSKVIDWVWSGITYLWKWIKDAYKDSWVESFVDEYIVDGLFSWFMGLEFIQTVVKYVKIGYNWIKENGKYALDFVIDSVEKLKNFLNERSTTSYIVEFINLLGKFTYFGIPVLSPLHEYLFKHFSFLEGIEGTSDLIAPPESLKMMKTNVQVISKEKVQTTLEYEALRMTSQNLPQTEIQEYLRKNTKQLLGQELSDAGMTDEDFETNIKSAMERAIGIIKEEGQGAMRSYDTALEEQTRSIQSYKRLISDIRNGIIDPTNPADLEYLNSVRNAGINAIAESKERMKTKGVVDVTKTFEDMKKYLDEEKKRIILKSRFASVTQKQAETAIENLREMKLKNATLSDTFWMIADDNVSKLDTLIYGVFGGGIRSAAQLGTRLGINTAILAVGGLEQIANLLGGNGLIDPLQEGYFTEEMVRKPLQSLTNGKYPEYLINSKKDMDAERRILSFTPGATKMALGGIMNDIGNIMPLDDTSSSYVRERIKNIESNNKNIQNKQKTETVNNITIIDNTIIHEESYEIYTLSHLSRGLLAGG